MKFHPLKQIPFLIALVVVTSFCVLAALRIDLFERVELMTYDWRARLALRFPSQVATNLGFAQIDDDTIDIVKSKELGLGFGLYWPRQVYGRLVNELREQGAETIAFDVLFGELRDDHEKVVLPDGGRVDSDQFFANQLRSASNVVIAATTNLYPPLLFSDAAAAIGEISTDKDSDGILRRARAFVVHRRWHPMLLELEAKPDSGVNLRRARVEPGQLIIPLGRKGGEELSIPLDAENNFVINPSGGDTNGVPQKAKIYTEERVWHMGIVMAARHLQLDLAAAQVDFEKGVILLRGPGVERIIPIDPDGFFYVDWTIRPGDARLAAAPVHELLRQNRMRFFGEKVDYRVDWRGKMVVIGSSVLGNDLTDRGATPLEKDTLLVSKHWNVANSLITGRFVRPASLLQTIILICVLGVATAFLTSQLRVLPGLFAVISLALVYLIACLVIYLQQRLWLPIIYPVVGALLVQYGLQSAYRALFEQREQRRVKGIFSRLVSPNIAKELLQRESLSLGGARSEVTVLFADVRGFTELTDTVQAEVNELIREKNVDGPAAEAIANESARETLNTVNAYLALVADVVKHHDGTLDKYIGDCVMAFWGAPTPQAKHAAACVHAAIEAQRAIHAFNQKREEENRLLVTENTARLAAGLLPKPLLPILSLGTGINTGTVTVGLMGSNDHILNYTVFGRDVNLASRLEGVSGRGRIIIGEGTYLALLRDDPKLAASCLEQEPTKPKGFQKAVRNFEVPWQSVP